jgi:hypothetical protein
VGQGPPYFRPSAESGTDADADTDAGRTRIGIEKGGE